MQKFILGMAALLMGLSVFAESDTRNIDMDDFPKDQVASFVVEKIKENCTRRFFENFVATGSPLARVKLEQLAEAMCDNSVFFRHYVSNFIPTSSYRPIVGEPLLLAFHAIPDYDLGHISALVYDFFVASKHGRENLGLYDLSIGIVTRGERILAADETPMEPGQQNIFNLDLDQWIREREKLFPGELIRWLQRWENHRETLIVVMVVSDHDAAYYEKQGHAEAAQFLSHFQKPIHFKSEFIGDHPRARSCQEEL